MDDRMTLLVRLASAAAMLCTAVTVRGQYGGTYVDDDAPPGGDGSSWEEAFQDLQTAIEVATLRGWGNPFRVAEGVYRPTPVLDRSASFDLTGVEILSAYGLELRGGYAGFGAENPHERDPTRFVSVISGDLLGDDGPGFTNRGDNSIHIIRSGTRADWPWHRFDGFTIRGGHANGGADGSRGAAVFNEWGSLVFRNCRFEDNFAELTGGAAWLAGNTDFEQCVFVRNAAGSGGGAIHVEGGSTDLLGSTLASNAAPMQGAILVSGGTSFGQNCIIWENGPEAMSDGVGMSYSCIGGGNGYEGTIDADPMFVDLNSGDVRLWPGSPCIDSGDSLAVLYRIVEDLEGNQRRVDDIGTIDSGRGPAPIVDMGPYEFQGTSCLADLTRDGALNLFDFLAYQTAFAQEEPPSPSTFLSKDQLEHEESRTH